jgi:hypothetical protein
MSQLDRYEQPDPALRTLSNICDHTQAFDPVQAAVNAGILDLAQDFLATGASTASRLDVVKIINKVAFWQNNNHAAHDPGIPREQPGLHCNGRE